MAYNKDQLRMAKHFVDLFSQLRHRYSLQDIMRIRMLDLITIIERRKAHVENWAKEKGLK